jgi:gamma-glutamyltranspeptidase
LAATVPGMVDGGGSWSRFGARPLAALLGPAIWSDAGLELEGRFGDAIAEALRDLGHEVKLIGRSETAVFGACVIGMPML